MRRRHKYVSMPTESISSGQNPDGKYIKYTDKTAIPKFASFKPNKPSRSQNQETGVSENIGRLPVNHNIPDEYVSRSKPHRQTLSGRHPRGHHENGLRKKVNRRVGSESAEHNPGLGENLPKSFVVDRVGDPNNLNFGALHTYATASYFRFGAGNVVGSPMNQRIDRVVSTDKGLVVSDDTQGLRKKRDKHARWRLDQGGERELKMKPRQESDPPFDSAADYVSFDAPQRAKRRRGDDGLPVDFVSSSDEDDTHYRSVEGKAKFKKEPADRDLKYNSDTSSSQDVAGTGLPTLEESAQKIRVQLSKNIDVEPTNVEAWIALISHQDNMLGLGQNFKRSLTNAEKRSNAEIKLTMFEKALENVKDSEGREVLLLGMMQEATGIWGIDKISSCWKGILQQNPQSLRLWTKYLDFMQTSFTCFRFDEVQRVYLDCVNLTHGARISSEIFLDELNKVFDIQIYIVLRMTLFMRESGFAEHATAAWQALLEFVFFKPSVVQASDHIKDGSCEATVSMFEKFWDSEVPRIGEEAAEGWASFSEKQREPPQPRSERADDLKDSKDHWKSWLASERRHGLLSRAPARTSDDIEENDPYRVILFSDIRPFLIDPPSLVGQQLILDAFLAFCCLPPFAAEGPDSRSRVWGRDCFLRNDVLRSNGKLQDSWKLHVPEQHGSSEEQDSINKEGGWFHSGPPNPFLFPLRDYQISSDSLFAENKWFSAFDTWQEQCFGDGGPVEVAWVLQSLKSLVSIGAGEEAVALYVLALELRITPGTVRKTAKKILRKRPFNIRLYNAYALIEYRLADVQKGESIITTSINMGKKFDEVPRRDFILLWRTWIWETLSAYSAQGALVRLLAIGDEEIQMPFHEPYLPDGLGSAEPALLLRTERVGLLSSSDGPC